MMHEPLHVTPELAARLEGLCAAEVDRFVATSQAEDPDSQAATLRVAGGVAAWVEHGMSVNQAFGLGFSEPVTTMDIEKIERFYAMRRQGAVMGVCPLSHHSLLASLAARRWATIGFENVLVRPLAGLHDSLGAEASVPLPAVTVTEATTVAERDLWARLAAIGFSAPEEPTREQLNLARIVVRRNGTRLFLAWVDGEAVGTGELFITDNIAWLSGDATLEHARRTGVQRALQLHRLAVARDSGATLAVSEADPGGVSQRNMERLGFRVAYTRVQMAAPAL